MTFDSFDFDSRVLSGIEHAGYKEPTPIQEEAIPAIIEGKDVLALSQTGTGKTAAFALPLLSRLVNVRRGDVRVLVLAPTRELAEQIRKDFDTLGYRCRLQITALYGGVPFKTQHKRISGGVEIVIATPGRLLDHLEKRTINFKKLETLILDEADRMLDMGFFPDVRKIMRTLPRERQNLLFSATMPEEVEELANSCMSDPVKLELTPQRPAETVTHTVYPVRQDDKIGLLLHVLEKLEYTSILVFVRTRDRAQQIGQKLEGQKFPAGYIRGDMAQDKRERVLQKFRDGSIKILVATDVAARGLDIAGISHVINIDAPDTVNDYIHRIGRTGRMLKAGKAMLFTTTKDQGIIKKIEEKLQSKMPLEWVDEFAPRTKKTPGGYKGQPKKGPANNSKANGPSWTKKKKPAKVKSNKYQKSEEMQPVQSKKESTSAGAPLKRKSKSNYK
ncbi:MAG: DEAD/DEAH box helicase [Desulfovibrio sp.]